MKHIISYSEFLSEKIQLPGNDAVMQYMQKVCDAYTAAPVYENGMEKHWDSLRISSENFYKKAMSDIEIKLVPKEIYPDAEVMKARVKKERIMYLSEEYCCHPYWTDDQYRTFRAVHDYIVHVEGDSDFTARGELRATNLHSRLVPVLARPAVFTEIAGKVSVVFITGEFGPQKMAVLKGFDYQNIGVLIDDNGHKISLTTP